MILVYFVDAILLVQAFFAKILHKTVWLKQMDENLK